MVRERSGLTNQFLHPPTAGDSLELEMKYFPINYPRTFSLAPKPTEDTQNESAVSCTTIKPGTRLKTLLEQYPNLPQRLPEIVPEFKMLNSPLGKLMIGKADVKMMSERSGLPVGQLIKRLQELIRE